MNQIKNCKLLLFDTKKENTALIKIMLSDLDPGRLFITDVANDASNHYQNNRPDLCLISVSHVTSELKNGLLLARSIRDFDPEAVIIIICPTSSQKVFDWIIKVRPNGFLSNEFSKSKLISTIELVLLNSTKQKFQNNTNGRTSDDYNQLYFIKIGDFFKRIKLDDISFFFAHEKCVYAQVDDRRFPLTSKLKELEANYNHIFIRTHKSYLVNMIKIDKINLKTNTLTINNHVLPIGYIYRSNIYNKINKIK